MIVHEDLFQQLSNFHEQYQIEYPLLKLIFRYDQPECLVTSKHETTCAYPAVKIDDEISLHYELFQNVRLNIFPAMTSFKVTQNVRVRNV